MYHTLLEELDSFKGFDTASGYVTVSVCMYVCNVLLLKNMMW